MRAPRASVLLIPAICFALFATACGGSGSSGVMPVVASFYPLAWAAERVGGSNVEVEDLTPLGGEAHDTTLTAGQRADLQSADVVLTLGDFGFQPDVERAAADASGRVVDVTAGLSMLPSSEGDLGFDPHVWLDPVLMKQVVEQIRRGLVAVAGPGEREAIEAGATRMETALEALDSEYAAALASCGYTTFVTTHEAFGYLAEQYGLTQLGVEGLTPESEPSAVRIQEAIDAIRSGEAGPAVFYGATDEGKRVGESVASDAGVPALPLSTLESAPSSGDYLSVMRDNLAALEKGLQCQSPA